MEASGPTAVSTLVPYPGWRTERAQEICASIHREERDAAAATVVCQVRGELGGSGSPIRYALPEKENRPARKFANRSIFNLRWRLKPSALR